MHGTKTPQLRPSTNTSSSASKKPRTRSSPPPTPTAYKPSPRMKKGAAMKIDSSFTTSSAIRIASPEVPARYCTGWPSRLRVKAYRGESPYRRLMTKRLPPLDTWDSSRHHPASSVEPKQYKVLKPPASRHVQLPPAFGRHVDLHGGARESAHAGEG